MKRYFLPLVLIYSTSVSAQFPEQPAGRLDFSKSFFSVSAGYCLDSKNVTNRFINTYRRSGFLGKDLKDQVLDKLDNKNTIGGSLEVELLYRSKPDSGSNLGWFAGLSHLGLMDARFTRDLFHVYFYGNKVFAGQTADLSNLRYRQVQYQQLRGGVYGFRERPDHRSIFAAGLGYVNGQDFVDIKTGSSGLYTALDGTYIDLELSLEARHADSSQHAFGSLNGSGIALYLFYQWEKSSVYRLTVELNDAGFIYWNNQSSFFETDTNYHFDGIQVNNLLDSVYLEVKSIEDYKNGFIRQQDDKSRTAMLPARLRLNFEKWLMHQQLLAGIQLQYRFTLLQLPLAEGRLTWIPRHNYYAGLQVQYGGYSGFHAGIRLGYLPVKNWQIEIGSNYLDGYLAGTKRGGQGAWIRLGVLL